MAVTVDFIEYVGGRIDGAGKIGGDKHTHVIINKERFMEKVRIRK